MAIKFRIKFELIKLIIVPFSLILTSHFLLPLNTAFAKITFLTQPSKIVACDITLKGAHRQLSQNLNILPVIRDINFLIQKIIPRSANDGISYPALFYQGRLNKMGTGDASLIVERLNGLEESIVNTASNEQYFVSEIRGREDIAQALQLMESREDEILSTYKDIRKDYEKTKFRGKGFRFFWDSLNTVQVGITGFILGSTIDMMFFMDPSRVSLLDQVIMVAGSYYTSTGFRDYFRANRKRLDQSYLPLKKALKKAYRAPSENDFFMSSSQFLTPSEFHHYLMEADGREDSREDDQKKAYARRLAFESGELTLWEQVKTKPDLMHEEILERFIVNSGDVLRLAFVDHIVYFDQQAGEPVWVSVYRAFRQRPSGRKPTIKKQEQRKPRESWIPAALPTH